MYTSVLPPAHPHIHKFRALSETVPVFGSLSLAGLYISYMPSYYMPSSFSYPDMGGLDGAENDAFDGPEDTYPILETAIEAQDQGGNGSSSFARVSFGQLPFFILAGVMTAFVAGIVLFTYYKQDKLALSGLSLMNSDQASAFASGVV